MFYKQNEKRRQIYSYLPVLQSFLRVTHALNVEFSPNRIIECNGGIAPLTYHQFQALISSMPAPPPAEPAVSAESLRGATTPVDDNHDERFGVPTLEELG